MQGHSDFQQHWPKLQKIPILLLQQPPKKISHGTPRDHFPGIKHTHVKDDISFKIAHLIKKNHGMLQLPSNTQSHQISHTNSQIKPDLSVKFHGISHPIYQILVLNVYQGAPYLQIQRMQCPVPPTLSPLGPLGNSKKKQGNIGNIISMVL